MATTTNKLALTKPDGTDLVDIAVLNANSDKIDAASGATICTSTTRPASPWNGQVIFETDTFNALVYRTSTSSWAVVGGSTVASTPPASAGAGNLWWDSDNGKLYIYYVDANSSQWVAVIPGSGANPSSTNVIINGAFDIWQRGTSFAPVTNNAYAADRWQVQATVASSSRTVQRFALASAISGLENVDYYLRSTINTIGSGTNTRMRHRIENVSTLAGKTVTLSWYGKVNLPGNYRVWVLQDFGTGGSTQVTASDTNVAYTTSWTRMSVTFNMPSIVGKTIGTDSSIILDFFQGDTTGSVFEITGVQLEENPQASAFKRNQPNIQAELAACQRYYVRYSGTTNSRFFFGAQTTTTTSVAQVSLPVTMRVAPAAPSFSNLVWSDNITATAAISAIALYGPAHETAFTIVATHANYGAANRPGSIAVNGTGFIEFNAEL